MRAVVLGLLLATATFAGCVDEGKEGDDDAAGTLSFLADWHEQALVSGEGHDHADRTQHLDLTTPNFEILGHDPLISDHYGTTAYGYLCGDAQATVDGRRLAAVESRSDVGFAIADVTDPLAPQWLGELVMQYTYVYDLAVVPDGKHVVLVTSEPQAPALPLSGSTLLRDADGTLRHPGMLWRSACSPEGRPMRWSAEPDPLPRPASLLLVDITDPSDPTIIDQRPIPGLGHSVFSTILDGRTWLLASMVGNPNVQTYQFYEILEAPTGAILHHLSTYATEPLGTQDPAPLGGHTDGWIARHHDGRTIAYLVGGPHFVIVDLEDPLRPAQLGYWTDRVPGRTGPVANLHSVFPLSDLRDGRHYTLIGPEFVAHPEGQPSGNVWVLDTTLPTAPVEVAGWTLPHEVDWEDERLIYSNHYLSAVGRTAFVSMYHGGVWALDLGAIRAADYTLLPAVGVFMPVEESPKPPERPYRWTPTQEEVLAMPDGTLVTFDSNSGLYTFRFTETLPAPPPEPWPVEPVTPR